ncbi:MAG: flagellar biosynthetic protein FliR [Clostridiales bacterium]|nr:flagellar biosynthetic protein FliR [Clostridiales bacterium]
MSLIYDINNYLIFFLVSCRITGVIFFNPILGRRNIPGIVKVGIAMGIALNATYELMDVSVVDYTTIEMILSIIKEFAIGFALSVVIQLFISIFHMGGQMIDLHAGLSMGSMYDPTTHTQISISGNLITAVFTLLFFVTNSHIALFSIAVNSFNVVPIGLEPISPRIGLYIVELFGYIFAFAVKLALPVIVTEVIVEVAVGILMRVVPNINVFVINLQLKVLVGIVVIISIIPVLVRYLERLNMIMLERLQDILLFFV